jgi:hypothetical protein
MTSLAAQWWAAIGGVLELHASAFLTVLEHGPAGWGPAIAVVVLAGASEAVGQCVILFANRVRAGRFVLCLLVDVGLFVFGYAFLAVSTWFALLMFGHHRVPIGGLLVVFALSYAPLLFAFLGALPYIGRNIIWGLRIWHLLAMVVGVATYAGTTVSASIAYCGVGWLLLSVANQTIGRPIIALVTRLFSAVAGVDLASSEQLAVDRMFPGDAGASNANGANSGTASTSTVKPAAPSRNGWWKAAAAAVVMLALAFTITVTLAPLHQAAFGWQRHLPRAAQLPLDLVWIGLIGVLVAGFMAPVETIGWWAGWYGDRVQTINPDTVDDAHSDGGAISRYIVYLDGISQSSSTYMPDVEAFLDALVARLPPDVRLVRGVMTYSPMNRPLDDDPAMAGFWKIVDRVRFANPKSLLGMIVNLRNVWIVAVSADPHYGPLYNFGIAQLVYDALIANGYRPRSGTPVTLLGYSGGGQMSAASGSFLQRALDAPVDVISLGGVISGSCPVLDLEHLYHFTGTKDHITTLGPIMFASRWKIMVRSPWNRALHLGRVTTYSLGPVGHQVPGGMMDPNLILADGRSALEQTLERVTDVINGRITSDDPALPVKPSNYGRFIESAWNRPDFYPIGKAPDAAHYRPTGDWVGRLILPQREERARVNGVWFEVHLAPEASAALVGARVRLQWSPALANDDLFLFVTRDVHFSADATYSSRHGGNIHPVRLNHWQLVDPLESLAGSHPVDDIIVRLDGAVEIAGDDDGIALRIEHQPVQVTGRYVGLVRFIEPAGDERYTVAHYDRAAQAFDGPREVVAVPRPVDDIDDRAPTRIDGIERSPLNDAGWYVYGACAQDGTFVVQALIPRDFLVARPERSNPSHDAYQYVRRQAWPDLVAHKGSSLSVRFNDANWNAGDRALLVHTYGGIGGSAGEKLASGPVYFGHFAYGFVRVVDEPLAGEPTFAIDFAQVYCHNTDGLIAGRLDVSRYIGDRQFGWIGLRPTCNILLRSEALTPLLDPVARQLDAMTARYRIGDGTGGTYVSAANNCAQDANRALFAALRAVNVPLAQALCARLASFGRPRRSWVANAVDLGIPMQDAPFTQLRSAFESWRAILPRKAADSVVGTILAHGADGWAIGSDQIHDRPELSPVVPMTI